MKAWSLTYCSKRVWSRINYKNIYHRYFQRFSLDVWSYLFIVLKYLIKLQSTYIIYTVYHIYRILYRISYTVYHIPYIIYGICQVLFYRQPKRQETSRRQFAVYYCLIYKLRFIFNYINFRLSR